MSRMIGFIFFLAVASFAKAEEDYRQMFQEAMDKFREQDGILRSEPPQVREKRFKAFVTFAKAVAARNKDKSNTYISENNFLSILTDKERRSHLGFNNTGNLPEVDESVPIVSSGSQKVAKARDFSKKIAPVKDQGQCGSCWTFGSTAALEGEIYFTTGKEGVSLSEQEFLDCARFEPDRDGCSGGNAIFSYRYAQKSGRIAPESAYPYKEKDNHYCPTNGKANAFDSANVKMKSYGNPYIYPIKGDSNLLQYANEHVVAVSIAVVNSFYGYKTGIYNERNCKQANHLVAVVGYGESYWFVRNSWGKHWGEQGHVKMSRDIDNICQISTFGIVPRVECRDSSCTKPWLEEGEDQGGDNSGGQDQKIEMCSKKVTLYDGYYSKKEDANQYYEKYTQRPKSDRPIIDMKGDFYIAQGDYYTNRRLALYYTVPCDKVQDESLMCEKKVTLTDSYYYSIDSAYYYCTSRGIPKSKCVFVQMKDHNSKDIYYNSRGEDYNGRYSFYYSVPCKGNNQDDGSCDAAAGLVLCKDCNCCKHKHMCDDY